MEAKFLFNHCFFLHLLEEIYAEYACHVYT